MRQLTRVAPTSELLWSPRSTAVAPTEVSNALWRLADFGQPARGVFTQCGCTAPPPVGGLDAKNCLYGANSSACSCHLRWRVAISDDCLSVYGEDNYLKPLHRKAFLASERRSQWSFDGKMTSDLLQLKKQSQRGSGQRR